MCLPHVSLIFKKKSVLLKLLDCTVYYLPVYIHHHGTSHIKIYFCSTYKCHDETTNQGTKKLILQ